MSPSNKEMQLQKNCELYAYLLRSLGKEIPEYIQECIDSYEDVFNCMADLDALLKALDAKTFDTIVNNKESLESRELAYWWEMRQEADRLHRMLSSDAQDEE
jgi:hypothetical protein